MLVDGLELFSLEKTKREEHGYGKMIYSIRKEKKKVHSFYYKSTKAPK